MTQALPGFVNEAVAQRQKYYTSEKFLEARELSKALGGDPGKTLDDKISTFLKERKIRHDTPPEKLAEIPVDNVRLLGATYYFGRRLFSTSYEVNGGTDPNPIIQNVFESLLASDNAHARDFLEGIAGVSSKVVENQRKVVVVINEVLTALTEDYRKKVAELDAQYARGTRTYDKQKSHLDAAHRLMLDKVVEYAKEVQTNAHHEPSVRGFRNSFGSDESTGNNEPVRRVSIDAAYLDSLIRTHRGDYASMIRKIEDEVGPIIGLDKNANIERATVKIVIYEGDHENPNRHLVTLAKGSVTGPQIGLLYAMRSYVLGKRDLTQDMRTRTIAFENVLRHLGAR